MEVTEEIEGFDCSPCSQNVIFRNTITPLFLGQILSFCLCGMGVSSQYLSIYGVNTPVAQNFATYFLLCIVYGTVLSYRSGEDGLLFILRKRGWKYFILAFMDVEANYMFVYAYQFTNLLMDVLTIPTVMILSWMFLSVRYLSSHIVGIFVCLVGIACLIWVDMLEKDLISGGSNRLLGDVLCLVGSLFYGSSNTYEEYLIKRHSRVEYLGLVGFFGSLIAGLQLAVFEHAELAAVNWKFPVIGFYLLFAICSFVFYSIVTVVIKQSSALLFNLSILTADFYSLLFGLLLFKYSFHFLYFVSFSLVIFGSIIYSLKETHTRDGDSNCSFFHCVQCFKEECSDQQIESRQGQQPTEPCPVHGRPTVLMKTQTGLDEETC